VVGSAYGVTEKWHLAVHTAVAAPTISQLKANAAVKQSRGGNGGAATRQSKADVKRGLFAVAVLAAGGVPAARDSRRGATHRATSSDDHTRA
jgi:hypothetical protein